MTVAVSSGRKRAQIDQFRIDAFFGELLGRFEDQADADRVGDERDMRART